MPTLVWSNPNKRIGRVCFVLTVTNRDSGHYVTYHWRNLQTVSNHWYLISRSYGAPRNAMILKEMQEFYRPKKFLTS